MSALPSLSDFSSVYIRVYITRCHTVFNANQYKQNQATNLCDLRSAKVIGHQGVPEWQSVSIHTVPGYQITKVPEWQSVSIHTVITVITVISREIRY